jgi:hypothetical protein
MFKISDNIATHGLGERTTTVIGEDLEQGILKGTDFWIVDVRDMIDGNQPLELYQRKIDYAIS